jgi:non-ribosomal peptide synthetase component F
LLLFNYSRQEDIIICSPISGRDRLETEGLIGFFTHILLLRTNLSGDPTYRELLARVSEVFLEAYAHQNIPVSKIKPVLNSPPNSLPPVFVRFAFQNIYHQIPILSRLEVSEIDIDTGILKGDLTLITFEQDQCLNNVLEYNSSLFSDSTIGRMIDSFQALTEALVDKPEWHLSELADL